MKKIIAILLLFFAMNAGAQHLHFMGIPLNGSIDAFQQKLIAKGLTYDKEGSHPGVRRFDGVFCGYDARVIVYYDTKTKVVYGAKAVISDEDMNYIERRYEEIYRMLEKKYKGSCYNIYEVQGRDELEVYVLKDITDDCDSEDYLGIINLYITKFEGNYLKSYDLHIEYTDRINESKYQSSKESDL